MDGESAEPWDLHVSPTPIVNYLWHTLFCLLLPLAAIHESHLSSGLIRGSIAQCKQNEGSASDFMVLSLKPRIITAPNKHVE